MFKFEEADSMARVLACSAEQHLVIGAPAGFLNHFSGVPENARYRRRRWYRIDKILQHHQSCRLAPVTQNISGMPLRSVTRWRLLPSLPR